MRKVLLVLTGAVVVGSCARKQEGYLAADSTTRDIQLPGADSTLALNDRPLPPPAPVPLAPPPPAAPPAPRPAPAPPPMATPAPAPAPLPIPPPPPPPLPRARLDPGTTLETAATREITSRHNKSGEFFTAKIADAVRDSAGRVVIPAGSEVTLSIAVLKPAPNQSAKDGTIELRAISVMMDGRSQPLDAEVTYVEHKLKGRGVGGSEAAKVGVGAAAGAVLGRVLGGGTGTAVGAVTGAAAGAVVAAETADRDVVVPVGAKIRLVLRSGLSASGE